MVLRSARSASVRRETLETSEVTSVQRRVQALQQTASSIPNNRASVDSFLSFPKHRPLHKTKLYGAFVNEIVGFLW